MASASAPRPDRTADAAFAARAADLDARDPLAAYPARFIGHDDPEIVAYLDGNSLGRPPKAAARRMADLVEQQWGRRLIRGWDEGWFDLPLTIGDRLARTVLGAAPGQATIGDSTTVLLFKLISGGLDLRPGRTEIVLDRENFPTDRYLLESIAAQRGLTLRWLEPDPALGVTTADLDSVIGEQTALVVLSHVAYRSGFLVDAPAAAQAAHAAGALLLLDLCHSAGSVELALDEWDVDLAVGCTYKYLNGGPGAPAFAYVAARHQADFAQPIWGWMGAADSFAMGQGYEPSPGIRRIISGTPAITGMVAIEDTLDMLDEVGMAAVRAKSVALTSFAQDAAAEVLAPFGAVLSSPSDPAMRGGHITLDHPDFRAVVARLWERGVIPDFRDPTGIRLGLSPLSTTFAETWAGIEAIAEELSA